MNIDFLMRLLGMPQSLEDLRIEHLPGLLNGDYDYLFILRNNRRPDIKVMLNKARRVEAELVEEVPNPHRILPEHVELPAIDFITQAHINIVPKSLPSLEYQKRHDDATLALKTIEYRVALEHIKRLHQRSFPRLTGNSD